MAVSLPRLSGPEVWTAPAIQAASAWRIELDPEAADELASAARLAAASGLPPQAVGRAQLPVTRTRALFQQAHEQLEHGAGFALLCGLPFGRLTYDQQVALTCGISDHVGRVVVQNYEGQRVVDVRDEGIPYSHRSRGYRSNKHLPFHTDGANLFTLTCLGAAQEGGETLIVSASTAYNALLDDYPDLLPVLCRGFYHHRRGQHDPGESPLSPQRIPVFAFHRGLLHCCYNRNPIDWAEKEGVRLSPSEVAALDALDEVLSRPALQLALRMRPGECLAVNNFITLHSRTEYRDGAGAARHMLRVWMNDPDSQRQGTSLLDLYVPARLRSN